MFTYAITYRLAQRDRAKLRLKEEIAVCGSKLREENGKITGEIVLQEEDDQLALKKAGEIANTAMYSLVLLNNIGLRMEDLAIKTKTSTGQVEIRAGGLLALWSFETAIGKEIESKLTEHAMALEHLPPDRQASVRRALHWFSRGLIDEDPVDQFVDYYVALEILGEILFSADSVTKRVENVITKFRVESMNGEEVTRLRSALMHSGQKSEDVKPKVTPMGEVIRRAFHAYLNLPF